MAVQGRDTTLRAPCYASTKAPKMLENSELELEKTRAGSRLTGNEAGRADLGDGRLILRAHHGVPGRLTACPAHTSASGWLSAMRVLTGDQPTTAVCRGSSPTAMGCPNASRWLRHSVMGGRPISCRHVTRLCPVSQEPSAPLTATLTRLLADRLVSHLDVEDA